jgi:hypothetical protein
MAFAQKTVSSKPVDDVGDTSGMVQESAETDSQSKIIERPEKKRLHWKGLTCASTIFMSYASIILTSNTDLAPLTTVGNLVRPPHHPITYADPPPLSLRYHVTYLGYPVALPTPVHHSRCRHNLWRNGALPFFPPRLQRRMVSRPKTPFRANLRSPDCGE